MWRIIFILTFSLLGCSRDSSRSAEHKSLYKSEIEYTVEIREDGSVIVGEKKLNMGELSEFVSNVLDSTDSRSMILFYLEIHDGMEYKYYEAVENSIIAGGGYPARKRGEEIDPQDTDSFEKP